MLRRLFQSLWLRIAVPFVLFVAAGSMALVGWMHFSARRESRALFAALARTNAGFIRSERLAISARSSESLSRVLGVEVHLWAIADWERRFEQWKRDAAAAPDQAAAVLEANQAPGQVRARGGFEAVAVPISDQAELVLVRAAEAGFGAVLEGRTWGVLGAFWAFSLALAWALAQGIVQPLRLMARRLPHIEEDAEATLPGAGRADEIGQLARAYLNTRALLAEERRRREQAERLAILGRMATGLAHEIHNPLSAMRMHAQLLDSTPPEGLAAAAAESVPVFLEETGRIEGLVNQWMFLARPNPPQTAPADLGALLAGVLRSRAATAAHAGVRLEASVPEGLRARVDSRRLIQALDNVVLNAIQAMPLGGALRIEGRAADGVARLDFCDSGPGFSSAALARHAELFFSEKEGGMGIGLNVCAEILKAHGGALRVANAANGGARVSLELPLFLPS